MRVFVMSDMEGVGGIAKWEQCWSGESLYEEGRILYTEEINAAVDGAFAAGATEVVAMDCHGAGNGHTFNSFIPERLDERCEWVVQSRWTEYTEFLEQGCDAAVLIGMHARAGVTDGLMNHTVSGSQWQEVRANGVAIGETGINAALCGTWGCPVVMVSGDRATCAEASELLGPGLTTVEVKQGLGRNSARLIHPRRARELIRAGAERALGDIGAVKPYSPGEPCRLEVDFHATEYVEPYRHVAGVEIVGPLRVVSEAPSWWEAWTQFFRL